MAENVPKPVHSDIPEPKIPYSVDHLAFLQFIGYPKSGGSNMIQLAAPLVLFLQAIVTPQPALVRFHESGLGRKVLICLDNQRFEPAFAGKLTFQDRTSSWQSVCADVRSPVHQGQFFQVRPLSSAEYGGYVQKAGNIVAKFFSAAQTADQCAGLQIAVWKTIEDGPGYPSFLTGRFRVHAGPVVLAYAAKYYQGAQEDGNAVFLQTLGGGSGGAAGGQGNSSPDTGQSQLTTGGGGAQ